MSGEAGGTTVVGDARPVDDTRFRVRLDEFEGPFDLLLSLISKHKLEVTELAIHPVTDDFVAHIRAQGSEWDLDETTEFLVIAATLLDLKTARLLPSGEVEDEEDIALFEARDLLFARLLQYRAYKEVAAIFAARMANEARRHPRAVGLEPQFASLLPEVLLGIGPEQFALLAGEAMAPREQPQMSVAHLHSPRVSVREQAAVIVARLRRSGSATFRSLIADADSTLVVVGRFLALLELFREGVIAFEQAVALGELQVRWTGGERDEVEVDDEFDDGVADAEDAADAVNAGLTGDTGGVVDAEAGAHPRADDVTTQEEAP